MGLHIRWMMLKDTDDVMRIERACFDHPWTKTELTEARREKKNVGMVAELDGDAVVAFMLYQLKEQSIRLLNFAVDPDYQRQQIGTAMVHRLKDKLSQQRRKSISCEVWEYNLDAQLFFRELGFRYVKTWPDSYDDDDDDCYEMRFDIESEVFHPTTNRITQFLNGERSE